ncbi:MAG TPA: SLBB domain-containing protein [Candidatus Limnocylindria bacterium]|nr:SLBB domain-containing protein [Candidatus Limnocylindria bacterium]
MRRWLVLAILAVALAGAAIAVAARSGTEPPVVETLPEITAAPTPQLIIVDVVGAVARPGVVHLPAGARVLDALLAAGGMTGDADLFALNKAAPLRDGARIYVPRPGEAVPAGALGSTAELKVNLNLATAIELDTLPGVGPATAAAIVRSRGAKQFAAIDELQTRGLVSPKVFADLRDRVTVR